MKHCAVLVLPEYSNLCLANTVEPLRAASNYTTGEAYRVSVVSVDGGPVQSYSGFPAPVSNSLQGLLDAGLPDTLFVLASYNYRRHCSREVVQALQRLPRGLARLGALDSGSYLLARAGCLDGYRATIHWSEIEDFSAAFPKVEVVPDRYVIDRERITCGGSSSALDLAIHLIRLDHGETVSQAVAELLLLDAERPGRVAQQDQRTTQLQTNSPRISRVVKIMQKHIEMPLSITDLATTCGISQRQLERDFRETMGVTVARYYLLLRLQAARRLIRETGLSVTGVAERCGFGSLASLTRAYRQQFGCTPSRDRHSQAG
jgi:transcriptional regulator GlxA family with amidase domain